MHFHRPPVDSTLKLIAEAPMEKLETGTRTVVEIVGYPDGQFRLVTSEISGPAGARQVRQRGVLMFVDGNEAKDALDALVDRLDETARGAPLVKHEAVGNAEVARRGIELVREEISRRGATPRPSSNSRDRNRLVVRRSDGSQLNAYVKTRTSGDWQTDQRRGRTREADPEETDFWILVDLSVDSADFYVVPEWWMENDIYEAHQEYLARHGGRRAVNPAATHHAIRTPRVARWRSRWDLLGLETPS